MSEAPLHLELAGVSLRYGEVRALQQVNLKVPGGQVVALIGANGAGKSSALRAITGLRNVAEGEVRLNGTVINAPSTGKSRPDRNTFTASGSVTCCQEWGMGQPTRFSGLSVK